MTIENNKRTSLSSIYDTSDMTSAPKDKTQKKIPSSQELNHDSNQLNLNERSIKPVFFSLETVYNAFKSCIKAIVSVFSYIVDKLSSFFAYIFSKLSTNSKEGQKATTISPEADTPANTNKNAIDNTTKSMAANATTDNKITTKTDLETKENIRHAVGKKVVLEDEFFYNDQDSIYDRFSGYDRKLVVDDNESGISNKPDFYYNYEPVENKEPVKNKASVENKEYSEDKQHVEVIKDEKTLDQLTSKYEHETIEFTLHPIFTENTSHIEEKHEDQLLSNTKQEPNQEDLISDNETTNEQSSPMNSFVFVNNQEEDNESSPPPEETSKTKSEGWISTIAKAIQPLLQSSQTKCFDVFFNQAANNRCDTNSLQEMSSYSQEEFYTIFIEKINYYLKNKTNTEPTPSEVITFIEDKINFIKKVILIPQVSSDQNLQLNQSVSMISKALAQYMEQQIKDMGNDSRYFTSADMSLYTSDAVVYLLQNCKCTAEIAETEFIKDIPRDGPEVHFIENGKIFWNSLDQETSRLSQKLKECKLELNQTEEKTQEYSDKFSEVEKIEKEIIKHRRSKIQDFINENNPEASNIFLREQSQATAAIPSTLLIKYIEEKLNDIFGEDSDNCISINTDRKVTATYYKTQDNKIRIKSVLSGKINFVIGAHSFNELYTYQSSTEVEYDLQNLANNRITKGEIKLFPITP